MSQLKIRNGANWIDIPAGGVGVPSGGSTGEMLVKSSSTDYATEWALPLSMKLLWTNPDQSSDFAAQTVPLDLSGYDAVCILVRNQKGTDSGWNSTHIVFSGRPAELTPLSGDGTILMRIATMSSTGVYFDIGKSYATYRTATTNNGVAVPSKIYGIKGVG